MLRCGRIQCCARTPEPQNLRTSEQQNHDRSIVSFRVEPAAPPSVIELPGGEDASNVVSMPVLRGRNDFYFVVQVVGSTRGTVWGSGAYTDDSSIATAAVHAGLLKPDELGFIRVSIAEGLESYAGSERNGIKSLDYGAWQGSFRLERVR